MIGLVNFGPTFPKEKQNFVPNSSPDIGMVFVHAFVVHIQTLGFNGAPWNGAQFTSGKPGASIIILLSYTFIMP